MMESIFFNRTAIDFIVLTKLVDGKEVPVGSIKDTCCNTVLTFSGINKYIEVKNKTGGGGLLRNGIKDKAIQDKIVKGDMSDEYSTKLINLFAHCYGRQTVIEKMKGLQNPAFKLDKLDIQTSSWVNNEAFK